jgi:hypothetical protein
MVEDEKALYDDLAAPFEGYYTAEGVFGPFLSGEQVAKRLNHVLGVGKWMFSVLSYSYDQATDEIIALGELRAFIDGQWVTRQQFGGQKPNRKKGGEVTSFGNDHKGAATDAMKKCASLFGVGLYLMVSSATWHEGVPPTPTSNGRAARSGAARPAGGPARPAALPDGAAPSQTAPAQTSTADTTAARPPKCMECERPLAAVSFPPKDGKPGQTWTVSKLRLMGLRRFSSVLCIDCFRKGVEYERTTGTAAG